MMVRVELKGARDVEVNWMVEDPVEDPVSLAEESKIEFSLELVCVVSGVENDTVLEGELVTLCVVGSEVAFEPRTVVDKIGEYVVDGLAGGVPRASIEDGIDSELELEIIVELFCAVFVVGEAVEVESGAVNVRLGVLVLRTRSIQAVPAMAPTTTLTHSSSGEPNPA